MRTIETHKVNGCNEAIEITVKDEPGHGGACHRYDITGFCADNNPSAQSVDPEYSIDAIPVIFQNGPIAEVGVNGITHEALLAVLIDRLEHFQRGPYACHENAQALTCLQEAQRQLQARTKARLARGVEGTHQV
jgi:hypothetical protein